MGTDRDDRAKAALEIAKATIQAAETISALKRDWSSISRPLYEFAVHLFVAGLAVVLGCAALLWK